MIQSTADIAIDPALETIQVGPIEVRFLVAKDNSRGSAAMFEFTVPAGVKIPAPAHSHDGYEETIYGLKGVVTWTVDGKQIEVGPGQALCIPRGVVHHFANLGQEDAKQLAVATPAMITPEYFREIGAALDAAAGGPPDFVRMVDILRRNGITPVLPGA